MNENKIPKNFKKVLDKLSNKCYNEVTKGEGEATRGNGQPHERQ